MALEPFGFFAKASGHNKPFSKLTPGGQRSQENALLRISPPGTSRRQARKSLQDAERKGRVFRFGTRPTAEQAEATSRYQKLSARSRLSRARSRYNAPPPVPPPPSAGTPAPPVTGGTPGVFNAYDWQFTPDGHLIEPGGRFVQWPDSGAAVNNLPIEYLYELSLNKTYQMSGYAAQMGFTWNEMERINEMRFWNRDAHIRWLQMSYEEYRAFAAEMAARMKVIESDTKKWPREEWMYH